MSTLCQFPYSHFPHKLALNSGYTPLSIRYKPEFYTSNPMSINQNLNVRTLQISRWRVRPLTTHSLHLHIWSVQISVIIAVSLNQTKLKAAGYNLMFHKPRDVTSETHQSRLGTALCSGKYAAFLLFLRLLLSNNFGGFVDKT